MKYTENMTFEEASKALIDELNANLATLHQNYHVEQSDWNKLYDQIANVVSEETHLPVFSPEVMEVRPRELECDVVRFQNNKEKWKTEERRAGQERRSAQGSSIRNLQGLEGGGGGYHAA